MKAIRILTAAAVVLSLSLIASVEASQVGLSVEMSNPLLKAQKKQTTFLKVGLTGFKIKSAKTRAPVNITLVLDKSGSMQGTKIDEARRGAIEAINRLSANDIVSVVTYDSTVEVLVPATKLTDKASVCQKIAQIQAGGRTALFAGVSKGAAELRKFRDKDRVNRIVLLSDGKANIGASSPTELGALGASLKKEGITVSTMGLGLDYNEDLMLQLASRSGGNHIFVEDAEHLAGIFKDEFNTVLSVVAQEVAVQIDVKKNIRPVRVLGREAEINGQQVITEISQLYSGQDQYVVLEVEVPATPVGAATQVATVQVTYDNMLTKATDKLTGTASVNFSDDDNAIASQLNPQVLEASVLLLANEQNKLATILGDKGDLAGAQRCLDANTRFLKKYAAELNSDELRLYYTQNARHAELLKNGQYNVGRKQMRSDQFKADTQRGY